MPFHAFFSNKQKQFYYENYIFKRLPISYYWKNKNDQVFEATHVFDTKDYPFYTDCPLVYDDKEYLGEVVSIYGVCEST